MIHSLEQYLLKRREFNDRAGFFTAKRLIDIVEEERELPTHNMIYSEIQYRIKHPNLADRPNGEPVFKRSMFYEILKKVQIASGNPTTLFKAVATKDGKPGVGHLNTTFTLTDEDRELLKTPHCMMAALCCPLDNFPGDKFIEFPLGCKFHVNNKEVEGNYKSSKQHKSSVIPLNLTPYIKLNGVNTLTGKYAGVETDFALFIYIIRKGKVEQLMKQVLEKEHIHVAETLKMIQDNGGDDISASKETLSLLCPCSYVRMDHPVRSTRCDHIQCFDLSSYLRLQEVKPIFHCPVCNKKIKVSHLAVDDYFDSIIHSKDAIYDYVEIENDGSWRPVQELNSTIGPSKVTSSNHIVQIYDPNTKVKEEEDVITKDIGKVVELTNDAYGRSVEVVTELNEHVDEIATTQPHRPPQHAPQEHAVENNKPQQMKPSRPKVAPPPPGDVIELLSDDETPEAVTADVQSSSTRPQLQPQQQQQPQPQLQPHSSSTSGPSSTGDATPNTAAVSTKSRNDTTGPINTTTSEHTTSFTSASGIVSANTTGTLPQLYNAQIQHYDQQIEERRKQLLYFQKTLEKLSKKVTADTLTQESSAASPSVDTLPALTEHDRNVTNEEFRKLREELRMQQENERETALIEEQRLRRLRQQAQLFRDSQGTQQKQHQNHPVAQPSVHSQAEPQPQPQAQTQAQAQAGQQTAHKHAYSQPPLHQQSTLNGQAQRPSQHQSSSNQPHQEDPNARKLENVAKELDNLTNTLGSLNKMYQTYVTSDLKTREMVAHQAQKLRKNNLPIPSIMQNQYSDSSQALLRYMTFAFSNSCLILQQIVQREQNFCKTLDLYIREQLPKLVSRRELYNEYCLKLFFNNASFRVYCTFNSKLKSLVCADESHPYVVKKVALSRSLLDVRKELLTFFDDPSTSAFYKLSLIRLARNLSGFGLNFDIEPEKNVSEIDRIKLLDQRLINFDSKHFNITVSQSPSHTVDIRNPRRFPQQQQQDQHQNQQQQQQQQQQQPTGSGGLPPTKVSTLPYVGLANNVLSQPTNINVAQQTHKHSNSGRLSPHSLSHILNAQKVNLVLDSREHLAAQGTSLNKQASQASGVSAVMFPSFGQTYSSPEEVRVVKPQNKATLTPDQILRNMFPAERGQRFGELGSNERVQNIITDTQSASDKQNALTLAEIIEQNRATARVLQPGVVPTSTDQTLTQAPVQEAQAHIQTPSQIQVQAPVQAPIQDQVQAPIQDQAPVQAPVQAHAQAPVLDQAQEQVHIQNPSQVQNPAQTSAPTQDAQLSADIANPSMIQSTQGEKPSRLMTSAEHLVETPLLFAQDQAANTKGHETDTNLKETSSINVSLNQPTTTESSSHNVVEGPQAIGSEVGVVNILKVATATDITEVGASEPLPPAVTAENSNNVDQVNHGTNLTPETKEAPKVPAALSETNQMSVDADAENNDNAEKPTSDHHPSGGHTDEKPSDSVNASPNSARQDMGSSPQGVSTNDSTQSLLQSTSTVGRLSSLELGDYNNIVSKDKKLAEVGMTKASMSDRVNRLIEKAKTDQLIRKREREQMLQDLKKRKEMPGDKKMDETKASGDLAVDMSVSSTSPKKKVDRKRSPSVYSDGEPKTKEDIKSIVSTQVSNHQAKLRASPEKSADTHNLLGMTLPKSVQSFFKPETGSSTSTADPKVNTASQPASVERSTTPRLKLSKRISDTDAADTERSIRKKEKRQRKQERRRKEAALAAEASQLRSSGASSVSSKNAHFHSQTFREDRELPPLPPPPMPPASPRPGVGTGSTMAGTSTGTGMDSSMTIVEHRPQDDDFSSTAKRIRNDDAGGSFHLLSKKRKLNSVHKSNDLLNLFKQSGGDKGGFKNKLYKGRFLPAGSNAHVTASASGSGSGSGSGNGNAGRKSKAIAKVNAATALGASNARVNANNNASEHANANDEVIDLTEDD
jgi:hypothetical protein